MSTEKEKREAVSHALSVAEKRLKELNSKEKLTRSEEFEKDQTIYTINLGRKLLGIK